MLDSLRYLGLATACVWISAACCWGSDHFILIGGGPSPFSNQVSLESNVLFAKKTIAKIRDDSPPQSVFFSDGMIDKPDLQYLDPDIKLSPAILWMTRLFGDPDSANYRYRNHTVPELSGPARKSHIKQAFYELADRLKAGDRLIVYVTAHGGPSEVAGYDEAMYYGDPSYDSLYYDARLAGSENDHDTTIDLWNNESLKVSELDTWLNKFSRDVRIVLIMAQCHSGGFAHAIFHHADKRRGLNPQLRIGFFSQRHDRAAAGCTPEIDERNYHEYSSYFWEAIGGATRTGDPLESSDFDGDGFISLTEAHAHAIISCETLDIPVTASEAFLRKFSRIAPLAIGDEQQPNQGSFLGALFGSGAKTPVDAAAGQETDEPLSRDQTIEQVLQLARPEQKAVISKISADVKILPGDTVAKVRRRANKLQEAVDSATQLWSAASMLIETERGLLVGSIVLQWPEFGSESFSPKIAEFITDRADEFVSWVEAQPQSDSYLQAVHTAQEKEIRMDEAVNREARMRRLLQTLEYVLLENNLRYYADESQQAHFQRMLAAEQEGLGATR